MSGSNTHTAPSNDNTQRRHSSKWKTVSAVTGLSCLVCLLVGILLVNNNNSRSSDERTSVSVSSLNSQSAIDEYISAVVENSETITSRPTNRIVPRPTTRPMSPTGRPTNRIVPRPTNRPSGRPSNRPTDRPSNRPTSRPSGRPSNRPTNEVITITITNPPVTSRPTPRPISWEETKLGECMGDWYVCRLCFDGILYCHVPVFAVLHYEFIFPFSFVHSCSYTFYASYYSYTFIQQQKLGKNTATATTTANQA